MSYHISVSVMAKTRPKSDGELQKVIYGSSSSAPLDKTQRETWNSASTSSSFSEGYQSIFNGEDYIFGETRNLGRQQKQGSEGNSIVFTF